MLYMAGTTLKLITTVINKEGLVYTLGVKCCLQRLKPRASQVIISTSSSEIVYQSWLS